MLPPTYGNAFLSKVVEDIIAMRPPVQRKAEVAALSGVVP